MLNAREKLTALSSQNDTNTAGNGTRNLYRPSKVSSEERAWTEAVATNNASLDDPDYYDVQGYPMRARTPIDEVVSLCSCIDSDIT